MTSKSVNPIDRHVGGRVRLRRLVMGLSQEKLGRAIGLTFQQVQKYEKGTNRIGASRLQQISETLEVPVAFFFEGAAAALGTAEVTDDGASLAYVSEFVSSADGLALSRAFMTIKSPKMRRRIVDLVSHLAGRAEAVGQTEIGGETDVAGRPEATGETDIICLSGS
jgi:transcriptional regulator with XRE-family HTH domain